MAALIRSKVGKTFDHVGPTRLRVKTTKILHRLKLKTILRSMTM